MQKPKDTRQWIIEKSADLFVRLGYNGTSISDIMAATGLKKGGIYNYFSGKDEIALEAFDYAANLVFRRFRGELDKCSTSHEKLMAIIDVLASFETEPVIGIGCPIFNLAVDTRDTHSALNDRSREMMQMLKKYIEIKIEEGVSSGEFEVRIPPSDIALLLLTTLEGAMIYSRLNIKEQAISLVARHMKTIINEYLTTYTSINSDLQLTP